MTLSLTEHIQGVSAESIPLWVDGWNYGQHLLNNGRKAPWEDVGAFISFHKQLQGLVKSDVLTIEIGEFYDFWLEENLNLLTAMGEKRRLGYAMRTLLADPAARSHLHEVVKAVCDSNPGTPVVLSMPSPRQWIASAHGRARNIDSVDVTWEDAESASMYVADFLRYFSDCQVSGILLRDLTEKGPASEDDVLRYQPVINVAEHYKWQVILDGCKGAFAPESSLGIALSLGSHESCAAGQKTSPELWEGGVPASLSEKQFRYVQIPEGALPERVLEVLGSLRAKS